MTFWSDTAKQEIARHWAGGLPASKIGALMGVTRNAILGLLSRNPELRGGQVRKQRVSPKNIAKARAARGKPQAEPFVPEVRWVPRSGNATVGRLLAALGYGMCRWPVNDAAKGEPHLFCGAPSDGSYCPYHRRMGTRE